MLAEQGEGTLTRRASASLMWGARGRWTTAMSVLLAYSLLPCSDSSFN